MFSRKAPLYLVFPSLYPSTVTPMCRRSFQKSALFILPLVLTVGCTERFTEPTSSPKVNRSETVPVDEKPKSQSLSALKKDGRLNWSEENLVMATPDQLSQWISQQSAPLVLVDFWATFCPPCVAKMPQVKKLSEKYSDGRLSVVAISCDDLSDREAVLSVLNRIQPAFPQWIVPKGAYEANVAFDLDELPTYRLFNNRGELIEEFSSQFKFEDIETRIAAELAK